MPDDIDISLELNNWLFALEGRQEMEARWLTCNGFNVREERCWHTTFHSLLVNAKSSDTHNLNNKGKMYSTHRDPVELITVRIAQIFLLRIHVKLLLNKTIRHYLIALALMALKSYGCACYQLVVKLYKIFGQVQNFKFMCIWK